MFNHLHPLHFDPRVFGFKRLHQTHQTKLCTCRASHCLNIWRNDWTAAVLLEELNGPSQCQDHLKAEVLDFHLTSAGIIPYSSHTVVPIHQKVLPQKLFQSTRTVCDRKKKKKRNTISCSELNCSHRGHWFRLFILVIVSDTMRLFIWTEWTPLGLQRYNQQHIIITLLSVGN